MKRLAVIETLAVCSILGFGAPVIAASAPAGASASQPAAAKPAEKCLGDVRAFTVQMSKQDGWLGGSEYGYGYPMGGFGYGYGGGEGLMAGRGVRPNGYASARPGYETRTLIASATILAKSGQEQTCQGVLASARTVYARYVANLRADGVSPTDQPSWRQRQIAIATPVTGKDIAFRSDQLVDTNVVSPNNENLGSVHDIVTDPQTGKITYVILSRGGLFGIDASYTPVPWADFKASPNGGLLVLDTTKTILAAAPQGSDSQFKKASSFSDESQKVDAYWTAHVKLASATN